MSEAVALALINLAVTVSAAVTVWIKTHQGQTETRAATQEDIAISKTTEAKVNAVEKLVNGHKAALLLEIEELKAENATLKNNGTTSTNQH